MKRYNRKALSNDINNCANQILEVKSILRESGQPRREPYGATEGRLRHLKKEATELCCLAAAIRGKLHLRNNETLEQVKERLAGLAALYEKKMDPQEMVQQHVV